MKYASLHEDVRVFKGELVHKLAMKRSAASAASAATATTPPSASTRCTAAKSTAASASCRGSDAGKTVFA